MGGGALNHATGREKTPLFGGIWIDGARLVAELPSSRMHTGFY